MSQSSISAYVRGETLPNRRTAYALAAALEDPDLLAAWGRLDAAALLRSDIDGSMERLVDRPVEPSRASRSSSWSLPLQPPPTYHPGDHLGEGIVLGRLNFGPHDAYIVQGAGGHIYLVQPIWSIESLDRLGFPLPQ